MKVIQLLPILIAVTSTSGDCRACFNGICHDSITLYETPSSMSIFEVYAIDRTNDIIYCSMINNRFQSFLAAVHYKANNFQIIPKYTNVNALVVDDDTKEVYIAGHGLFTYNPYTNSSNNMDQFQYEDIYHLQFKDKLYYAQYDTVSYIDKNVSTKITDLDNYRIKGFVVDKNKDIYFNNGLDNNVYRLKNNINNETEAVTKITNETYNLSLDKLGEVHLNSDEKLYKMDYNKGEIVEVGHFDVIGQFKPLFDNNNHIVYGESDKLLKFEPNSTPCQ